MKRTMQYSVGGQMVDVGSDRVDEFQNDVAANGDSAKEVATFRIKGKDGAEDQEVPVSADRIKEFQDDATANGDSFERVHKIVMDDGETLSLGENAIRQYVQARKTGQMMSRGLLKQAGIPDAYGKSRESREQLADALGEMFPEEPVIPQFLDNPMNVGDYLKQGLDTLTEGMKKLPALDEKATNALLHNPVIDNILMKEGTTVGEWLREDGLAQEMVKGGNDFSNALVGKILSLGPAAADIFAEATRLVSPETAAQINGWVDEKRAQIAAAFPTDTANLETGSELGNKIIEGANKFTQDTLATVGTFAIPGAAAVDISAGVAKTYWDSYAEAKENGADDSKAESLAATKAGIGAVEGIILAGAAKNAKSVNAFTAGLKKALVTGAKGAATRGASDLVQQGIEGAENPDLIRTGEAALEGGAEMAAFDAFASAVHGVQHKAFDGGAKEAANRAQERKEAEAKAKTKAEAEKAAKERFDANLSDEAIYDLDKTIEKQVAAETIPSWRHAEEVKRRAIEKLGKRENGENHEAVEQAVIEAADEVNAELMKPERVESAALERRQAEYEMKLNEAKAKREAEKKKFGKAKTPLPEKPVEPVAEKPAKAPAPKTEPKEVVSKTETPTPRSRNSLSKMKTENVIKEPDSMNKYYELLDRAGLKLGNSAYSQNGMDAKAEIERMNKNGWGDLYKAKMEWAMADKKTRGEQPPDTPEEFKAWKEKSNIAPADAVKSAQKLLGTKFYQDEASLKREMAKLPPQATKAREAYETAIAEARKRAEAEKSANAEPVPEAPKVDNSKASNAIYNWHRLMQIKGEQKKLVEELSKAISERSKNWNSKTDKAVQDIQKKIDDLDGEYDFLMKNPSADIHAYAASKTTNPPKPTKKTPKPTEKPVVPSPTTPAEAEKAKKQGKRVPKVETPAMQPGEAEQKIQDWIKASPEQRETMPIADAIREIHKQLNNGESLAKAINKIANTVRESEVSDPKIADSIRELTRYAEHITGNADQGEHGKGLRPRVKQNGEGSRLKTEKSAALRDIDDRVSMALNGHPLKGEIEATMKQLADAKKNGEGKRMIDTIQQNLDRLTDQVSMDAFEVKLGETGKLKTGLTLTNVLKARELLDKRYGKEASQKYYDPNKPLGEGLVDTAAELERIAKAEAEGETSGGNQGLPARSYSWGEGSGKGRFDHFVSKNSIINLAKKQFPQFAFRGEGTTRIGANYNGHWEPYREIIRSKDMSSIDTIPHEIGHGIDSITRKSALAMPMEVRKELVKFGRQLYGDQKPNGGYTGEGFAEYIRGRICGADNLEAEAPNLHKWFNTVFAKKHPEIVRKIDLLQNEVTLYRQQTSAEKVAAFMKPSVSRTEKIVNRVKDFFSSDNWLDDGAVLTRGIKNSGIDKMFKWQPEFRELEKLSKTDPKKRTTAEQSRIDNLTAAVSDKIQNDPRILQDLFRGTSSTRAIEMSKSGVTNLFGTKKLGNVTGFDKSGKAIRDNDTKSESEIFRDFSRKELADWDAYAIAKVGLENYVNEGYRFGVERDTLETTIKKLESPKFEKALEEYTKFSRRVLSIGLESGALSREDYEAITGAHKYYVRIERRFEDKANGLGGSQSSPLHKIKGSVRNVLPPRTATMIQNERLIRHFQAAKILNSIGRAVQSGEIANTNAQRRKGGDTYAIGANLPVRVPNAQEAVSFTSEKLRKDFVKRAGIMLENRGEANPNMVTITKGGKVVTEGESMAEKMYEELYGESGDKLTIFREKPSKGKNGLVSTYIDGKLVTFELPDEAWGKYITGLESRGLFESEGAKTAWRVATATSRSLRLGATIINPPFAMTNAARDTVHAAVMSNAGISMPGWNVIRGVYNILHGSESKKLFAAMGGDMKGSYGVGKEESYKAASREAAAKLRPADRIVAKLYNPVSNGISALSEVLSVAEIAPRLAEMDAVIKRARSAGISDDAASILGFLSAKDVSIDFGKRGKAMKYVNDLMPYTNAWIRGLEQMARKMGVGDALPHEFEERNVNRFANTVGRSLLFITLPTVATAIAKMQTSTDEEKEAIFKKEPREKWDFDDSLGVRIAQPFELGSIFHAMAKAAVYEYYGDDGAMQEAAIHGIESNILRFKNPEDIARGISFISPWLDIAMNRDYKGSPIVSPLIKDTQEAKNWKDFSTTPIAETLGEWFDIAPAYIDHVANAYTGGTWKRWMSPAADNSLMTISGLSAFRPRPTARRDVSEFYEFADKTLRKSNSGDVSLEDYGKLKRAEKLKDDLSVDFKEIRELRKLELSRDESNDRRIAIMKRVYAKIKKWEDESKSDRDIGIRKAVDELTNPANAEKSEKLEKAKKILKDVSPSDLEYHLIQYGRERVNDGKGRLKQRWSVETIRKRIHALRKATN